MIVEECKLPKANQLVADYLAGEINAQRFFDYDYRDLDTYLLRVRDLKEQIFPREALVEHLLTFNRKFTSHPNVFENIEKLRLDNSAVVITGQQAGFLTGPLYTIYKAVSTVMLAKQLEEKLNIPVAPVFWVAGEDHDFQEVNHVWVFHDQLEKEIYRDFRNEGKPISMIAIDKKRMEQWLDRVFYAFGETKHSKHVLDFVRQKLEVSHTVSDFFIRIMSSFFEKHGLIFVDSANEELRNIEAAFFHELVKRNEQLRNRFHEQSEEIVRFGYPLGVDAERECVHLFYHDGEKRRLLYEENGLYQSKDKAIALTKEELVKICSQSPAKLSNNVVTRPLMQEYLFPTLAFVAGPGEITYWAQLKSCFHLFNKKMPPIVPRMHVTIVERNVHKLIRKFNLSLDEILSSGVSKYREEWFKQQKGDKAQQVMAEVKEMVDLAHAKLRKFAWETDHNLGQISEKNRQLILQQLDYMEKRIEKFYEDRFSKELSAFNEIEAHILPNGNLQERVWNIFYYANQYGIAFIDSLFIKHELGHAKHHILYI